VMTVGIIGSVMGRSMGFHCFIPLSPCMHCSITARGFSLYSIDSELAAEEAWATISNCKVQMMSDLFPDSSLQPVDAKI
jgi:hypothetical protein